MRKHDIFTCENNMLSSHVKRSRFYGYMIHRAFRSKKNVKVKWFGVLKSISRVSAIFFNT